MNLSGLSRELEAEWGIALALGSDRPVSGGFTNEAIIADTKEGGSIFLKLGAPDVIDQFITEKRSLELLRATDSIQVPEPLVAGIFGGKAVLVLEALKLKPLAPDNQGRLGSALAQMQQSSSTEKQFGASFDNFIGATPQPNSWTSSWADFFTEHRLGHQFRLTEAAGFPFPDAAKLTQVVYRYLEELDVSPSLVHGDLWGGNASDTEEGIPVIFDPAAYFGDREVDIAFTKLFGGFDDSFYEAYRDIHPAPPLLLHEIYNLYHLLNHNHLLAVTIGIRRSTRWMPSYRH
jgi:fructosamine-3-kinase